MRLNTPLPVLLALMCIFVLHTGVRGQITLNVPSTAFPTIQSALNAAVSGDTIQVAAGTYFENLVWPAKDVHVIGAGPALSTIDGGGAGACVTYLQLCSNAAILEGFTLTNGTGTPQWVGAAMQPTGGAIHIAAYSSFLITPTVRDCLITGNTAYQAGGLSIRNGGGVFDRCRFVANISTATGAYTGPSCFKVETSLLVEFRHCEFSQHSGQSVGEFSSSWAAKVLMEECRFLNNNSFYGMQIRGDYFVLRGCEFRGNICGYALLPTICGLASTPSSSVVESCAFVENSCSVGIVGFSANVGSNLDVHGITVAGNTFSNPTGVVVTSGTVTISDSVVQENTTPSGVLVSPVISVSQGTTTTSNSSLQGITSALSAGPYFADPTNGDYRLSPGSILIDAGSLNSPFTSADRDAAGESRLRGAAPDIGAYEAQGPAYASCSSGNVGVGSGGPYDIMLANGSAGGVLREVEVPIGSSVTLEMLQPLSSAAPLNFSVFGILGKGSFDTVVNVPLGIGDMVFAPAPMAPWAQPFLFTLASSVGSIGGVAPLFGATPTPWSSGPGPAIPFPITMTLQGVIEESPGVFTTTNALALIVR